MLFKKVDGEETTLQKAHYQDALWGGNIQKVPSYIWAASLFFLSILTGAFIAFFIFDFPWQLAGIIAAFAIFFGFTAFSRHFDNRIFKYFFLGMSALIIIYLLIHAGLASNRALGTTEQLNVGYLAIGILYATILAAIIFCIYLLYLALSYIYKNFIAKGKYIRRLKTDLSSSS